MSTITREGWQQYADLITATFRPGIDLSDALAKEGWFMAIKDQPEEVLKRAVVVLIRSWQGPPPRPADLRRACLETNAKEAGIDLNAQTAFAACQAWAAECNGAAPDKLPPPPSALHAQAVKEMGGLWAWWRMDEDSIPANRAQFAKLWAGLVAKVNLASTPGASASLPEPSRGPRRSLQAPVHVAQGLGSILPPPPPPPPPTSQGGQP